MENGKARVSHSAFIENDYKFTFDNFVVTTYQARRNKSHIGYIHSPKKMYKTYLDKRRCQ